MRNVVASDATSRDRSAPVRRPAEGPRSSDRVLQLLVAVASAGPTGLTLADAAAEVGLVPSTALRQLRSLVAAGLLDHDATAHRYRVGPTLRRIARQIAGSERLEEVARPWLDRLAAEVGESCYLAVTEGEGRAVYAATSPGVHALRHTGWVGRSFATRGTAVGAALAGRSGPAGCAVRSDALEPGITAIAAPVRDGGRIVGAVSIVGPTFRLDGTARAAAESAVVSCAQTISDQLGGAPGT